MKHSHLSLLLIIAISSSPTFPVRKDKNKDTFIHSVTNSSSELAEEYALFPSDDERNFQSQNDPEDDSGHSIDVANISDSEWWFEEYYAHNSDEYQAFSGFSSSGEEVDEEEWWFEECYAQNSDEYPTLYNLSSSSEESDEDEIYEQISEYYFGLDNGIPEKKEVCNFECNTHINPYLSRKHMGRKKYTINKVDAISKKNAIHYASEKKGKHTTHTLLSPRAVAKRIKDLQTKSRPESKKQGRKRISRLKRLVRAEHIFHEELHTPNALSKADNAVNQENLTTSVKEAVNTLVSKINSFLPAKRKERQVIPQNKVSRILQLCTAHVREISKTMPICGKTSELEYVDHALNTIDTFSKKPNGIVTRKDVSLFLATLVIQQ